MSKISFNAQALGISSYQQYGNVSGTCVSCAQEAVVPADTSVNAIFEGLGFTNIHRFPSPAAYLPAKNVKP